jgi:hypothetical protein
MRNIFLFSALLVLLVSACKTSANEAKKQEERPIKLIKYYVRYIEQSKELQVEAKFFNQNDSAFAMPGGVMVSDFKLEAKSLPKEGWMHRYIKRPSSCDSLYVFNYKSGENYERNDSVFFQKYNNFQIATPKISKKTGGLITWNGSSLTQDDGLTLVFEDAAGVSYTINHVGITRGAQLEVRPEHLEVFAKGKAILRAVHKRSLFEKRGDTRMVRLTEYYRTPKEVEIVD